MLAFARRQELKPERVDVERLVGGMAELMARSLGPTITVDIRIAPRLPPVETDPTSLEAALLNLAVNARDAMQGTARSPSRRTRRPSGRATKRSRRDAMSACRKRCRRRHGRGDAASARRSRSSPPRGSAKAPDSACRWCRDWRSNPAATLILKSAPRRGTTAEIWLPAAASDTARAAPAAPPRPQTAAPVGTLSILAVDDDALIRMSTVEMLEDLGHTVVPAGSGREALELLGNASLRLVVTDYAMPHMTGAQFIAEARATHPALPVVLATGYAEMSLDTVRATRLAKPFTQADLADALARVVAGA